MVKVLALLFALISTVANAPGISLGNAHPSQTNTGTPTEPKLVNLSIDSYRQMLTPEQEALLATAADNSLNPSAWLDFAIEAEEQSIAWRHSWTDIEPTAVDSYYATPGGYAQSVNEIRRQSSYGALLAFESPPDLAGNRARSKSNQGSGTKDAASDGPADPQVPPSENDPEEERPGDDTDNDNETIPTPPGVTPPVTVPEPGSLGLLALSLAGLAVFGRRRSGA